MYYVSVVCLMVLFPALSIGIDAAMDHVSPSVYSILTWFTFWAVGVRLLLAGARQIIQPRYTAQSILGIQGDEALLLVRELGFANVALGTIGVMTLAMKGWLGAAALAGGIFYAFAGINHLLQGKRNRLETTAMATDLFAAIVLLGCGLWMA